MIKLKDGFEGTLVDTVVKDYNKTNEAARKEWEAKEKALFLLMRDCLHSQTVCSQMGVTSRTVRNYLKSAYEKLKKELQK